MRGIRRCFTASASAVLLLASPLAAAGGDVIVPADQIKWEAGPAPGSHVAKLWGDWMKGGAYGVLVKFDAGTTNALHHHTHSLKIVVMSGTFSHTPEGGKETRLGPGSYLLQAGKTKHASGCADGGECTFFLTSADKFDMIPADKAPAAKK